MCLPFLCLWLSSGSDLLENPTVNSHALREPIIPRMADDIYPRSQNVLASMRSMSASMNYHLPPSVTVEEPPLEKLPVSVLARAWGFDALYPEVEQRIQTEVKLFPYRTDLSRTSVYSVQKRDILEPQYVDSTRDIVLVYKMQCVPVAHQVNVVSFDFIDRTLRDYWFLQKVYELAPSIVPQPLHLSSAHFSTETLSFGKIVTTDCEQDTIPLVRYMVMELLPGFSVRHLIYTEPEAVLTVKAIDATMAMISAISSLHKVNVIHGDAHADNFIWLMEYKDAQSDEVPKSTMKILDFEQSSVLDKQIMAEATTRCTLVLPLHGGDRRGHNIINEDAKEFLPSYNRIRRKHSFHAWSAPWEYISCSKSFRNDVHKIFTSLARWMHGKKYIDLFNKLKLQAMKELENGRLQLAQAPSAMEFLYYKMNGQIFELRGDDFAETEAGGKFKIDRTLIGYDREIVDSIRIKFHQLENTLFDPPIAIEQRPDYDKILGILDSIKLDILRGKPQH